MTATALSLAPEQLSGLRGPAYRVCATLFLYPDAARLARLKAAARVLLADATWASCAYFGSWCQLLTTLSVRRKDARADLQERYTGLFLHGAAAPPQESFYMDPTGQAGAVIANALAGEYAAAGLAVTAGGVQGPDFLATELEFLAFLCDREARAWCQGSRGQALELLNRQERFLTAHLARWLPAFTRKVQSAAPGSLFALAAAAASDFTHHDLTLLRVLLRLDWERAGGNVA